MIVIYGEAARFRNLYWQATGRVYGREELFVDLEADRAPGRFQTPRAFKVQPGVKSGANQYAAVAPGKFDLSVNATAVFRLGQFVELIAARGADRLREQLGDVDRRMNRFNSTFFAGCFHDFLFKRASPLDSRVSPRQSTIIEAVRSCVKRQGR
jgi:hypothetical protein